LIAAVVAELMMGTSSVTTHQVPSRSGLSPDIAPPKQLPPDVDD
jgi:hypothetical protein